MIEKSDKLSKITSSLTAHYAPSAKYQSFIFCVVHTHEIVYRMIYQKPSLNFSLKFQWASPPLAVQASSLEFQKVYQKPENIPN